jgi:16S rRNA (cytosine967-C5)-methyltransferase
MEGERAGLAVRQIALDILIQVDTRDAFADVLLGARIADLPPADRRLVTRLVLGTLAWRGRLDFEISHLATRPVSEIDKRALQILRLGLFQLRMLDRIPPHAAVDTAVQLAKRAGATRHLAGFTNAVMRRATREAPAPSARAGDEIGALAIELSHPRWMVERFIEWFGRAAAERLMLANNDAAPNAIRLNLALGARAELIGQLKADGFEIGTGGHAAETVILRAAPRFDSRSYRTGLFHAQSEVSQVVARMLGPRAGAVVVDCAAAPGGKATHLAELVGERGRVIALDRNLAGLRNARALGRRLRHRNLDFIRADIAAAAPPLRQTAFEYVLLDAPCTGMGTLREHPEIKWRLSPEDPARMAAMQTRMLEHAAMLVAPGGAIVYAVCSIAPDEGIGVVSAFLRSHPEFTIDSTPPNRGEIGDLIDSDGCLRTRPDRGGLDGFFAARLVRAPG